jgi:phage minor structural protein
VAIVVNVFTVKGDNGFTLSVNPISTDNTITGTVAWGDGSTTDYAHQTLAHTYTAGGTYTITYTTSTFESFGNGTFAGSTYLVGVTLDEGIKYVGNGAFAGCSSLESISFPPGTIVQDSAAPGSSIKSATLGSYLSPSTVALSDCGTNAFTGCTSLEKVTVYTADTSLAGTTVGDYFILATSDDTTTYIPVEYVQAYIVPAVITGIPESNYVSVYSMRETNFSNNGLRILRPTSCTITEELNGDYSLTLTHPCDAEGTWLLLREFNIIKACGQLFRIYKTSTKLGSNGAATHTVYAQHIFYDLAHRLVKNCTVDGLDGQGALNHLYASIFNNNQDAQYGYIYEYSFNYYSDITSTVAAATYEMASPVACLIGEDNSIVNRLGGELYRDNFYFSVCSSKEGSRSDAFVIKYGLNMLEVQEDVDYSNFCTYLHTEDNYGNEFDVSYTPNGGFPHHYSIGKVFNYNESDINVLGQDMGAYFGEYCEPVVTYSVKFANLHNYDLYRDFIALKDLNVGDTGTVFCERLGINTTQKVVSKTYDVLKGETTSITLGNFAGSIARREKFANVITRKDNLISRVISPYTCSDVTQGGFDSLESSGELKANHTYYVYE